MFSAKTLRRHLLRFKRILMNSSIEADRIGQEKLGKIMARPYRMGVDRQAVQLPQCMGEWIRPKKRAQRGVILYLHGGGYVAGGAEYAAGFGSVLCGRFGMPVFCPIYRLAPEYPYPAALQDAAAAYEYLLTQGYAAQDILLHGESAGGGLVYALMLLLKEKGMALPAGAITISPWVDLTMSGASYLENAEVDPSMARERLEFFARHYVQSEELLKEPGVSPLFGNLSKLPPSLILVGGDEVMLDDARMLYEKLKAAGSPVQLHIAPGMWHAYLLYGMREVQSDMDRIQVFIRERIYGAKETALDAAGQCCKNIPGCAAAQLE